MNTYIVLMDRNAGLVQYLDRAPSPIAALQRHLSEIGADFADLSLDDFFVFDDLSDDEAEQVREWVINGSPSILLPDCLT
jgi:hypothetical protein